MKAAWVKPDAANLTAEYALKVYRRRFSKEQLECIDARLIAGESPTRLAREACLPELWFHNRKEQLRKQRRLELPQFRPHPRFDRAQEMWRDGLKIREIAAYYRTTLRNMAGVIEYYRAQFGLFPRRNRKRKEQ